MLGPACPFEENAPCVLRIGAWTHTHTHLVKTRWAVQVSAGQLPFSKIDLLMRMQDMFKKTFCIPPLPSTTTHMVLRARNCQCHGKCKVMIPQNRIKQNLHTQAGGCKFFTMLRSVGYREASAKSTHVFSLK